MLRNQELVEELYVSESYRRAYFIYRNELAPKGDKYAQYMIGYMHFTGVGVVEDPAIAHAWYRLAAERGEPVIEAARVELRKTLSPEQIVISDRLLAKLKREMGDRVIILDLVQEDLELLRDKHSRVNFTSSPMTIIDRRYGPMSGAYYYQRIKNRVATRLSYLKRRVDVVDVDSAETEELAKIESEINELIADIDKR